MNDEREFTLEDARREIERLNDQNRKLTGDLAEEVRIAGYWKKKYEDLKQGLGVQAESL